MFALASLVMVACTKDQLDGEALICEESVVYEDIRNIMSQSCGYSGCHNGIDRGENYNTFAGLESSLSSGLFSSRVLLSRDMPPDYAVNGPTSLTIEQIEMLQCWEQNGFTEF